MTVLIAAILSSVVFWQYRVIDPAQGTEKKGDRPGAAGAQPSTEPRTVRKDESLPERKAEQAFSPAMSPSKPVSTYEESSLSEAEAAEIDARIHYYPRQSLWVAGAAAYQEFTRRGSRPLLRVDELFPFLNRTSTDFEFKADEWEIVKVNGIRFPVVREKNTNSQNRRAHLLANGEFIFAETDTLAESL